MTERKEIIDYVRVVDPYGAVPFYGEEGALRIAPQQAYRGFTLKTPIWEPYIYLRSVSLYVTPRRDVTV